MKMSKNYKKICLALALSGAIGAGAVGAKSGTQRIDATYRNIQVTYNGVTQSMSNEPFLVNNSVYVPLAAVGNIFGVTPKWIPTSNTVALTGGNVGTAANPAVQEELTQANYRIAALTNELSTANAELAKAKAELAQYKTNSNNSTNNNNNNTSNTTGTNITNAQLKDTENYLNQNFSDYIKNVPMTYNLSMYGSQIQVEMVFDSRSANIAYKKLYQNNINAFMKKIGDNIAATHSDVSIEGRIIYTGDNSEKASFSRTRTGGYTYTHSFDKSMIQDLLSDEIGSRFYLEGVRSNDKSVSSLDATYDVSIRTNSSKVNITVNLGSNSDFVALWGIPAADSSKAVLTESDRRYAVRNQLSKIYDTVAEVTNDYEISINVLYNGKQIASMDADERITVDTFSC